MGTINFNHLFKCGDVDDVEIARICTFKSAHGKLEVQNYCACAGLKVPRFIPQIFTTIVCHDKEDKGTEQWEKQFHCIRQNLQLLCQNDKEIMTKIKWQSPT